MCSCSVTKTQTQVRCYNQLSIQLESDKINAVIAPLYMPLAVLTVTRLRSSIWHHSWDICKSLIDEWWISRAVFLRWKWQLPEEISWVGPAYNFWSWMMSLVIGCFLRKMIECASIFWSNSLILLHGGHQFGPRNSMCEMATDNCSWEWSVRLLIDLTSIKKCSHWEKKIQYPDMINNGEFFGPTIAWLQACQLCTKRRT